MRTRTIAALAILLSVAVLTAVPADAEGETYPETDETCYYYGNSVSFEYPRNDGAKVTWNIVGWRLDDGSKETILESNETKVVVDLGEYRRAVATLTVEINGDTAVKTHTAIPLHLNTGKIPVRFHIGDGTTVLREIDGYHKVEAGSDFVPVPEPPVRKGYEFRGWVLADGSPFDPKAPILEKDAKGGLDIYASWKAADGSTVIGQGSAQVGQTRFIVVFETTPGMTYTVTSSDSTTVRFTVSVVKPFVMDGEPEVTCNGAAVPMVDGEYVLSGIDGDRTVRIVADVSIPAAPDTGASAGSGSDGIPWWAFAAVGVAVAMTAVAVAAVVMLRRRG